MRETYRKWGRSVRLESGHLIRVEEAGEAVEEGDLFACEPIAERVALEEPPAGEVERVGREIREMVEPPMRMSRTPPAIRTMAPLQGADSRSILAEAGVDATAIDALKASGALIEPN